MISINLKVKLMPKKCQLVIKTYMYEIKDKESIIGRRTNCN